MREISQEAFNQASELFRDIEGARRALCEDGLTLARKLEIKRHIKEMEARRRHILGVDPFEDTLAAIQKALEETRP